MTKRLLSFLLVLTFIFTVAPIGVFATSVNTANITVVDASAMPGETVEVYVIIKDNPGVTGATLTVAYDKALTLTDAVAGAAFSSLAFSKPGVFASPCNFVWDAEAASDESTENGIVMKLLFEVDDTVEAYTKMNVDVSYSFGDVYNNQGDVYLDIDNGYVTAIEYVPGDVNGDNRVTTKDTQLIRQLIAGGYETTWAAAGITVNSSAADVNDDGRVNSKDTQLIRQVVAGGYTDEYGVPVRLVPVSPECKHSLTAFEASDATCTEKGNIAYWYCGSCDSYFSDAAGLNEISESETVVESNGHSLLHFAYRAATCAAVGNIEHWTCSVCGDSFVDGDGIETISKEDTVLPLRDHTYSSEWTADGDYHWLGAMCGHSDLYIDRAKHTFVGNVCSVCEYDRSVMLGTPTISKVEYDTVHWNAIENADQYLVRVNGDYEYLTRETSCELSKVINNYGEKLELTAEKKPLDIKVQVMAVGHGLYADSGWSSVNSGYKYVPSAKDTQKTDELINYCLGYGYNLIEDEYLRISNASNHSVLDTGKLLAIGNYSFRNSIVG